MLSCKPRFLPLVQYICLPSIFRVSKLLSAVMINANYHKTIRLAACVGGVHGALFYFFERGHDEKK